ncbi:hypothetical protein [Cellulomonas marina]|uniref:Uncharacterized protein n=1 Tax=Cellulomonas marina TaxID=988821 RepID=A0A1I0Z041_9CELL|nr:hypothetical protein [Cellulomonas marina]SFB18667.1 hypothetical protein SAMN05421867_10967 [Cellulomonas marina]
MTSDDTLTLRVLRTFLDEVHLATPTTSRGWPTTRRGCSAGGLGCG